MKAILAAICLMVAGLPALAQSWGNLDALLYRHLTSSGTAEASFWLPDTLDPTTAERAIGVVYEYIPGSAGNTGIAVGSFVKQGSNWIFTGQIDGLWGHMPRDALFGQSSVDVTTTTLGPNEPRCCPTQVSRWRIDLASLKTVPLN
tara:strand:- start:2571 stop:3008 length:438 start_codon:yes stop_codon:yes gene_type:complete